MLNSNEKPQSKGTAMIGPLPLVPVIILLIWVVMMIAYFTVGLPHNVSLPIVLGTIAWFVIWLIRANRRG